MKISLSPIRYDGVLTLAVKGDSLILNGEVLDLSAIPKDATLPRAAVDCFWLASDIERVGSELQLTVLLPHGAHAPDETLFPAAISTTKDGPVTLPDYEILAQEEEITP